MKATDNLYDFLAEEDAALVIPAQKLPLWASEALNAAGENTLTVCHTEEGLALSVPDRRFTCRLLEFEDEAAPPQLAVVLQGAEPGKTLEAFAAASGWSIPEVFLFFLTELAKLDASHQLILAGDGRAVLENSFFIWKEPVPLLPGILELDQLCLQITKAGMFRENLVTGFFSAGGLQFALAFQFSYGSRVSVELQPVEGVFPGFTDFMKWLTGESDVARRLFSWMDADAGEFDAALESAGLTLDLAGPSLVDAAAGMKLTLFGMPFRVSFSWAGKTLQASLWEDAKLSLGNLLENIGASCKIPEYLQKLLDMSLDTCLLEAKLEDGEFCFRCGMETGIALGNFALQGIQLEIVHNAAGTALSLSGFLVLHTRISIGKIPLAVDLLPDSFSYTFNQITVTYSEGAITSAGFLLAFQSNSSSGEGAASQEEEKELPEAPLLYGAVSEQSGTERDPIGKRFGPAFIDQAGFLFLDGRIIVQVSGGLRLHGVDLTLKGLRLGYDLNTGRLTGGLDGMDLSIHTDVYSLEGSMYCGKPAGEQGEVRYDGAVRLKVSKWAAGGMASYTKTPDGRTSLFVFVSCSAQLGGVPAFQVTGVMGGLGLNRELALPDASQLERFPLLQTDGGQTMGDAWKELTTQGPEDGRFWLSEKDGADWFALGVRFRSFGLVDGKLLLCFLFGEEVQAALLGSAEMSLPKGSRKEDAYAYFKIFLSAVFKPKQGSLLIRAVLSEDSFLLRRDCRITGGAAYAMWFGSNAHSGDFVLTAGGYHPSFARPEHYPEAGRLQFQWQVSPAVSAKGEAYLAVTPACIMAGGSIRFLFQEGGIKAWFEAFFDLLMQWHPFYFAAKLKIEIGVSVTLHLLGCKKTVALSAGAELGLWGPAVGGRAKIHLSIISFTVSFGADRDSRENVLDWEGFRELLPDGELHHIRAEQGIAEEPDGVWVCGSGQFTVILETEIPAGTIGIRPMGKDRASSSWKVEVTAPDGGKREVLPGESGAETVTANVPKALWGQAGGSPIGEACLLKDMTVGYRLDFSGRTHTVGERLALSKQGLIRECEKELPLTGGVENAGYIPKSAADSLTAVRQISDERQRAARERLCGELSEYYAGACGSFSKLAAAAEARFSDSPMLCGL